MNEMVAQLAGISGLAQGFIWHGILVFLRVGAAVALLPAIGEQMVPQRIRLSAALAITLVVAPAVSDIHDTPPGLLLPMVTEAAAGLTLGFGLRILILALQTAGTIAAQSTSLAQMFAGTGPEPQPIVANLLVLAGLALFVAMGGLERSVSLLILSYELIPPGHLPTAAELADWGLRRTASAFALSFSLAAPFVLAALLYNLALGAINRAMPQLMVSFVGAPALTLGGLALLALVSPLLLTVWRAAMEAALAMPPGG
ncbi:flagellar biosynthetic protein FliR [Rhodobacter sp.]